MEISDVRVKLITNASDRLKAVCAVTFDEQFVVRDVKVVEGTNGLFVAMPSRKLSTHCAKCNHKNTIRSRFCNDCGAKLPPADPPEEENGRSRFHRDVAHPITTPFRELLQTRVLEAYHLEHGVPPESTVGPAPEDGGTTEKRDSNDGGLTEYDAIIAGFRSGGGGAGPRRPAQPSPRGVDGSRTQGDGRHRGQGSGRTNERGGRSEAPSRRSDEEKPRRDQPCGRSAASIPPNAEPVARTFQAGATKPDDRSSAAGRSEPMHDPVEGFGVGIMDDDPRPVKPAGPPKSAVSRPEPVSPPPAVVDDDGDNAFGAGIL